MRLSTIEPIFIQNFIIESIAIQGQGHFVSLCTESESYTRTHICTATHSYMRLAAYTNMIFIEAIM